MFSVVLLRIFETLKDGDVCQKTRMLRNENNVVLRLNFRT